jgi:hypothetical protein
MKKTLIAVALAAGLSTGVYAQGTITLNNDNNTSLSSLATANGLVFTNFGGHLGLEQGNVSITLLAGPVGGSLTPVTTILGSANFGDGDGFGQFTDGSTPGIYNLAAAGVAAGAPAEVMLEMWEGSALTYVAATTSGSLYGTSAEFINPTGGGTTPPTSLTGMPAVILTSPEPSTIILGGLGAAALLALRRRKQ